MATALHSDSRRLYSWWWDSHISPKNSKWLQENLTDMDAKVKSMIKLIEEDADSFARRAEMYYKKRPELMKLVEEFYRAYRALAERYDHATVELRHAHKTMAEAFPSQMAYEFADDSPSGSSVSEAEPHTPEMPHPLRAFSDPDDLQKYAIGLSSSSLHSVKKSGLEESDYRVIKRGLNSSRPREGYGRKGLNYHDSEEKEHSLHDGFSQLSNENQKLKTQVHSESERASKAEDEVQSLKEILAKMRSEKEAVLILYQQSLEKLSNLEREFICAQKEAREFDERASKAETEIKVLEDTLRTLKAERDAGLLRYKQCSERISELEAMISLAEQDAKGLSQRAIGAETEAQKLKQELSRVEAEKEAGLLQYKVCLKKISDMENEILLAGEHAKMLTERTDRAETEVKKLRLVLDRSNEEKEAVALQYKECLDKIARLENEISRAQEDARRLNNEILMGATKLKSTEEQVVLLNRLNQSLRLEADNLVQKMVMTDQELLNKKEELGKLQIHLQDEHSRFLQVEASLLTSQKLHTQYQEEQRTLALELRNGLLMLKDLDVSKHGMEEEIRHVKEENQCLNELKLSSDTTLTNQQNEITSLREMKEKLEQEVARQVDQSNVLEGEICSLKGEIRDLNQIYQAIMDQIQSVGLQPQCLGESVKELQVENSKLKEICKKEQVENEALSQKLVNIEKLLGKNSILEASLSDTREELLMSKEKLKALQESVQFLQGERSSLVAEKAIIFSQLQVVTETMRKLFEKNTTLENSLAGANAELEGLRAKSKSLEEICQWHSSEKSNLRAERSSLVLQLESVEGRLRKLENRFAELEEKYAGLEKEKKSALCQVEELQVSLDVEKQEHTKFTKSSDTRLAALENNVCLLQKGSRLCKEDFEEELDKAVNEQVEIFILQKFIEDLEEKNFSLLIECQKHVEASKLSDKLIAELESENLEQQMEAEFFLDQIEWLRKGISRVFKALQIAPLVGYENKIEQEHAFLPLILERIGSMKYCAEEIEDERQQLLVENMVLTTLLEQLKSEGIELESEKKTLDEQFNALKEQFKMLQNKNDELLEMNMQLSLKVREGDRQGEVLEADKKILQLKLEDFQGSNFELQEQNSRVLEENISLLKECSDLEEKKCMLEDENGVILHEAMVFSNLSLIFKSYWTEKALEQKALAEDLNSVHGINIDLKRKVGVLHEKLELKEAENLHLKESFEKINTELHEVRDMNDQLKYQTSIGKESLIKKDAELSEAEQELRATHNLNTELCRTVEVLKKESEESKLMGDYLEKQIVELSKDNNYLTKEIECLREVNGRLESELGKLHGEVEERRSREENLSSDLQERSKEFELWEAEAMTFYFDLQISSIHEVLLEDKVHELTGVCENLEREKASKNMEIEKMKEKVSFVENEIGGLKAQLSAYVPVVDSLSDDIASLEHNANFQRKIELRAIHGSKDMEVVLDSYEKNCVEQPGNESTVKPDGISALQKMQSRIKSVEKAVVQQMEMLAMEEALNANIKVEAAKKEIEELKSRSSKREKGVQKVRNEISDHLQWQKIDPEIYEETDGILMKDIPLDQNSDSSFSGTIRRENGGADEMLELWETAEQNFMPNARVKQLKKKASASVKENFVSHQVDTEKKRADLSSELQVEKELGIDKLEASIRTREPSKEGNKRKILERLASDAQKMISIQVTVQGLRRKMEANNNTKKSKDVEYGTTKEHLQEVEEAVVQLMDMNSQLIKNIEESPSFSDGNAYAESEEARNVERKRVLEQARKGSEKIVQLQLEMQKIQYALLKLEGKKESNLRSKFPKGTTSIVLKNFIYSSPRSSRRRKKPRFCGCLRPSTAETLASP